MQSSTPLKSNLVSILGVFLLLLLLSACGANTPVQGGGIPPAGNSTTVGNQNASSFTAQPAVAFDVPGLLHIQPVTAGLSCSPDLFFSGNMPGALVLATNNLAYESAVIQQMQTYSTAIFHKAQPGVSIPAIPTTLRLVPGNPSGDLRMWNDFSSDCNAIFQITNISNSKIQLSQISMEYTAASQPNNYSYRLINICSLLTSSDDISHCPPVTGGGGSGYYYKFQLKQGSANTAIQGQLTNAAGEPLAIGPTLDPAGVVFVSFSFVSPETPKNIIYRVRPKLTLDVVNEQQSIELPQLDSTLAFADTSQFSCYTLQGGSFTQLSRAQSNSAWCV